MPRVSREQTEKNHDLIEEVSARLFRERGLNGVSVAELMSGVGLTHGGFYGHFESKDELAAAACKRAFGQSAAHWRSSGQSECERHEKLLQVADAYLSPRHRDNPGAGCAVSALAADVAREPIGKPVRAAFAAGCKELTDALASLSSGETEAARKQEALARLALMVGAMTLARAMSGDAYSDEVLAAARASLGQTP